MDGDDDGAASAHGDTLCVNGIQRAWLAA